MTMTITPDQPEKTPEAEQRGEAMAEVEALAMLQQTHDDPRLSAIAFRVYAALVFRSLSKPPGESFLVSANALHSDLAVARESVTAAVGHLEDLQLISVELKGGPRVYRSWVKVAPPEAARTRPTPLAPTGFHATTTPKEQR